MADLNNISVVLRSPKNVAIEARQVPVLSDSRSVLVRIASTGICGSDAHYYQHGKIGQFKVTSPMVLGHESAGIVISVGADVTKVEIGDRIALEPGIACRHCDYCQQGRYNLCRKMRFAATPPVDGTLCDVFQLPQDLCYKLPESLSLDEGAMAEPLSVAVHVMITQARVRLGHSIVIFGAGPVGLLCCMVARAFGADKVISVDINKTRLDFAKRYAATDIVDARTLSGASSEENAALLAEQVGLRGGQVDIAVDASGVESSIRLGIHLVKPGGTFVQAGMGRDDVNFPMAEACSKELTVRGSFRYGPGDYDIAIKLMAANLVDVKPLITKIVPFEHAEEVLMAFGNSAEIKTIIRGPSFAVDGNAVA